MTMAQGPTAPPGVPGSFSLHSFADSSNGPALSEAEEIHEVKKLIQLGENAFRRKKFEDALRCYNDSLDIDELSIESLAGRAAVYIETNNFINAEQDAERLLSLDPEYTQGHYLKGIALHNLGKYREALDSFLNAIDLEESDSDHMDILTNNVASIATKFCEIPDRVMHKIPDMDSYKKMCEVGCCLYQAEKYERSIKVLNAAQKLQTNQKGITMKVQLTLANAHAALKHNQQAIAIYQDCLATSFSAHDPMYQTKALVNIASLFLEIGDTHQAIVFYEKLLDLQKELQNEDDSAPLPEYWTHSLQCALHLNMSIAYKTIGCVLPALSHAHQYVQLCEAHENKSRPNAEGQSHYNVGMLHEILEEYDIALGHYKKYLENSKQKRDKKATAQAYGSLGNVYAHLKNRSLSISYHEQHINLAKKLEDPQMLCLAYEQMGDTYMVLKDFDKAVDLYTEMYQSSLKNDLKNQTTGLCKLGSAYKAMGRPQYSIYYFESALDIAEDFKFTSHQTICEYNLACLLQQSTQMNELEKAKKFFQQLIPLVEGKVQQHRDENTFCPKQLIDQLEECYDGMQTVLCKLGENELCLNYAEAYRKKSMTYLNFRGERVATGYGGTIALYDAWTMDKINRVISQQNGTIIYYSLLRATLMIWVLQPGKGLVRFYNTRTPKSNTTFPDLIKDTIAELRNSRNIKEQMTSCENRALPRKEKRLESICKQNEKLSSTADTSKTDSKEGEEKVQSQCENEKFQSNKNPQRRLFDYIIAPIYDILSSLEESSSVIFIPNKELLDCPFPIIEDWGGKRLSTKFYVTVCPSLYALDKCIQNELNQLKIQDDLENERRLAKFGGAARIIAKLEIQQNTNKMVPYGKSCPQNSTLDSEYEENVDLRRISNPRLATSRGLTTPDLKAGSRENTMLSQMSGFSSHRQSKAKSPFTPRGTPTPSALNPSVNSKQIGQPTPIEKVVNIKGLTTVTTRTSTDTDVTRCEGNVVEFKQVSGVQHCLVIGAPVINNSVELDGNRWKPAGVLKESRVECFKVAEQLDVTPIVAEHATKMKFLEELAHASVVHIATIGCSKQSKLVFTPNPMEDGNEKIPEGSYIVTAEEISRIKMAANLVVISACWSSTDSDIAAGGFSLPAAFLAAGAECVLTLLWPIPNKTLNKFYHHFYSCLQHGSHVTTAVAHSVQQLQDDNRYKDAGYWAPFTLIGRDMCMNLNEIRHVQLDQTMDKIEKEYADEKHNDPLNPPTITPTIKTKDENLTKLQELLAKVLCDQLKKTEVLNHLAILIDGSLKRLHVVDNIKKTTKLSEDIIGSKPSIELLKFLGFHFQPSAKVADNPYVIYPHSNFAEMLVPSFEAIDALLDINQIPGSIKGIIELLPLDQEHLAYLVDLLCIVKHAPEIQLKVSDLSVKPLWRQPMIQKFLTSIGFHQIGLLLNFNSIPTNRKLLVATLQLAIAFSAHKNPVLLHKLDVTLLGPPANIKELSSLSFELSRLPTLTPLLLPRNQLRMSTPWLSGVEKGDEMDTKIQLAKSKSDLDKKYKSSVIRAKTWHQMSVAAQATEVLEKYGEPVRIPKKKVKVQSGSSSSRARVPVDAEAKLKNVEMDQRRDYAQYVYDSRLDDVASKHRGDVQQLFLPYITTV